MIPPKGFLGSRFTDSAMYNVFFLLTSLLWGPRSIYEIERLTDLCTNIPFSLSDRSLMQDHARYLSEFTIHPRQPRFRSEGFLHLTEVSCTMVSRASVSYLIVPDTIESPEMHIIGLAHRSSNPVPDATT